MLINITYKIFWMWKKEKIIYIRAVSEYVTIIRPNITNNNNNGNNTKNHEISLYPALHNEFNIKVQNNM